MSYSPGAQKPHISPSQLDMYFRCGEQYRRRYVNQEKLPPGIALIKGSSVHVAAEANHKQKIESHEDLPVDDLKEIAASEFENRYRTDGLMMTEEERGVGLRNILGGGKDSAVKLTGVYAERIAPTIQPAFVEEWVRIPLLGYTHDLNGRIDVIDDRGAVRDLKTASARKNQAEVDNSDQLTYYHVAVEKLTGKPPAKVQLDVVIETRAGKLDSQVLESTRDHNDRQVLANKLGAMLQGIKAEVFLPATPGHWCCSPKFCGYWQTCPYVNSHRKAAAEAMG